MASVLYQSFLDDLARGLIDFDGGTFKVLLVTSAYTPNANTHAKRSDVSGEVVGAGYTAGGEESAVTVTRDDANARLAVAFAAVSWPASTMTWRGAVIYQDGGGAALDRLVAYVDNGGDTSTSGGDAEQDFSSPLRLTRA
jgi:hypothetical protein